MGLLLTHHAYAATYMAKSTDSCYMTATTDENQDAPGITFRAVALNNHRLDAHCADFVLKLQSNLDVFVANLTADDLNDCSFHDHEKKAGLDNEIAKVDSKRFILVAEKD